jgi:hypothetical protein
MPPEAGEIRMDLADGVLLAEVDESLLEINASPVHRMRSTSN